MSKTLGNGIDPRWILDGVSAEELPDYARRQYPNGLPAMGTDALRFTLLTAGTPGNDLNLNLERVETNRNFANKIWNIARFVLSNLGSEKSEVRSQISNFQLPTSNFQLADRWIIARLNQTIANCTRLMDAYEFGQAGTLAHEFLWGDFADWYVEYAKVPLTSNDEAAKAQTRGILLHVLDMALRLLHPFVPFVTEALWQHLPHLPGDPPALIIARWPEAGAMDEAALTNFGHLQEVIRAIRNVRAEKRVPPNKLIPATLAVGDKLNWLAEQRPILVTLARLEETQFRIVADLPEKPRNAIALVIGSTEIYLPLEGLVNLDEERARLQKELADLDRQIAKSEGLLNSDFVNKAPAAVVEKERARLMAAQDSRAKVEARLKEMGV
jgi:valyl-tRNA synthetase